MSNIAKNIVSAPRSKKRKRTAVVLAASPPLPPWASAIWRLAQEEARNGSEGQLRVRGRTLWRQAITLERLARMMGFVGVPTVAGKNDAGGGLVVMESVPRQRWRESFSVAFAFKAGRGGDLSTATMRTYQRELVRLFLYCDYCVGKAPLDLTAEDLIKYFDFVVSPPSDWIETDKKEARKASSITPDFSRSSPPDDHYWRPFAAFGRGETVCLVPARVLSAYYRRAFLKRLIVESPLHDVTSSKFALSREESLKRRLIHRDLWAEMCRVVESLEPTPTRSAARVIRAKYIFDFLYYTAARRSEMGQSQTHREGTAATKAPESTAQRSPLGAIQELGGVYVFKSEGKWDIRVVGKGGKSATIHASDALIKSWSAYRVSVGRPPLPDPTTNRPDDYAVVYDLRGIAPVGSHSVYRAFKWLMKEIAVQLLNEAEAPGLDESKSLALKESAMQVLKVSPHWMRHRSLTSFVAATGSLAAAQAFARHAQVTTTTSYVGLDDEVQRANVNRLTK